MRKTTRTEIKEKERRNFTFITTREKHRRAYLYYLEHGTSEYLVDCILAKEEGNPEIPDGQEFQNLYQKIGDLQKKLDDIEQLLLQIVEGNIFSNTDVDNPGSVVFPNPAETDANGIAQQDHGASAQLTDDDFDEFENWNF
ncbi:MAG: hypothetical protein PUG60_05625 [Lachnospiraceae bacterium]|nr:hypothetical protein [Lachnospiraceae bacterium]